MTAQPILETANPILEADKSFLRPHNPIWSPLIRDRLLMVHANYWLIDPIPNKFDRIGRHASKNLKTAIN